MFERATVFSAILLFTVFGIIGLKYYRSLEAKTQVTLESLTSD